MRTERIYRKNTCIVPGAAFMEEGTDTNASVEWTDNGDGTWTAKVSFVEVRPAYFAFAKFTKAGKTVVRNVAPTSLAGGVILDDGTVIRPKVSGGTVTWEVAE